MLDPDSLCWQCNALPLRRWLTSRHIRLLWALPDYMDLKEPLKVSPSSSCAMCRLLAHSLGNSATISRLLFQDHGDTLTLEGHSTQSLSMRVNGGSRIVPLGASSFRLGSSRHTYARILEPGAASRQLMRDWLSTCETSHVHCREYDKNLRSQPTAYRYLIDVEDMCVRDTGTESRRYFALSYVCGQVEGLQLLRRNISELNEPGSLHSNFERLPRVIKDAITITQDLGERFLWVDALCICQDDARNKHWQIANMNHIYKGAFATLVALHSNDATNGLPGVQPYNQPRVQHIERVHLMRMTVLLPAISEYQTAYFSRAWTYQEELFSRRLLYFSKHQVHFRCLRSTYSEDTSEDDPMVDYGLNRQLLYRPYPYTKFDWWKKTVSEYSNRDHSFAEDRYNAFDGIANELSESWAYPCIRGLPIRHIASALCWQHQLKGSLNTSSRILSYPSWSWCGWTSGITFNQGELNPEISSIGAIGGDVSYFWSCNSSSEFSEMDLTPEQSQLRQVIRSRKSAEAHQELETKATLCGTDSPEFPRFVAPNLTLFLSFITFSALLDGEITERDKDIYYSITPSLVHPACGLIRLSHLPGKPMQQGATFNCECILIAKSSQNPIQRNEHKHFLVSAATGRKKERAINISSKSKVDPPISPSGIAHIMLVEHRGDHCERIAIGEMNEHCFWNFHPIERHIKLG